MNFHQCIVLICWMTVLSCLCGCSSENHVCLGRIDYFNNNINDGLDIDSLFAPISEDEYDAVINEWIMFDYSSRNVSTIEQYTFLPHRNLKVVAHKAQGRVHYGAIVEPVAFDPLKQYPLIIWAEGLNQMDPLVKILQVYGQLLVKSFPDYFVNISFYLQNNL